MGKDMPPSTAKLQERRAAATDILVNNFCNIPGFY
jgi:hypothetical protein